MKSAATGIGCLMALCLIGIVGFCVMWAGGKVVDGFHWLNDEADPNSGQNDFRIDNKIRRKTSDPTFVTRGLAEIGG